MAGENRDTLTRKMFKRSVVYNVKTLYRRDDGGGHGSSRSFRLCVMR